MDRDWARLGRALKQARAAKGMTQDDLAEAASVGRSTIQSLERGTRTQPKVLPVHRIVANALGWADGSVEAVLAGGDPVDAEATGEPDLAVNVPADRLEKVDTLLDDLTARVREALLGGTVADATAIDLGPDDEGGVVIIWKRGEKRDLTPDEQRDLNRRWSKLQHAAHNILADNEEQEDQ